MDITRRRAAYQEGKVASSSIEDNGTFFGWKLPIEKEGVVVTTLDFEHFSGRPKLARMFMAAFKGLSPELSQTSLETYVYNLTSFWDFLDTMESAGTLINEPKQVESEAVKNYIVWLNGHTEWSVAYQYYSYMTLKSLLKWLKKHHRKELAASIDFPGNPYPRKNAQVVHRPAYSTNIAEQIKNAALSGIEDIKKRIETPYVKTGKGIDPRGLRGSISSWNDFDNVVWYFENVLDCQYRKKAWLIANGHTSFNTLTHKYHGAVDNVWETIGVWNGTTQQMLIPFILLLAYLSGANPTPIITMRRDCIKQHPTLDRRYLVLEKVRSGNAAYKIKHSSLCITIVERVLEITRELALEANSDVKDYLWLYRRRDGRVMHLGLGKKRTSALEKVLNAYAKKHDIRDESGTPVNLNLARLRPTFATRMFVKTKGDVVKLKTLLNHEWLSNTFPYISSAGMEDMRENAAKDLANQENKLRAKVAVDNVASELGISPEETVKILSGDYDTYLGKCRNLLDSPLQGEKKGRPCTRFNNCLKCPSCVITATDLHRLFSYDNHIKRLQKFMSSYPFGKTYGWVILAIDEVRTKFRPDTIEKAQAQALSDPFPAWDTKLELAESLEKIQQGNGSDTCTGQEAA
jgi:hypothetical protein